MALTKVTKQGLEYIEIFLQLQLHW